MSDHEEEEEVRYCLRSDLLELEADAEKVTHPINGKPYLVTGKEEDIRFLNEFGKKVYVPVTYTIEDKEVEVEVAGYQGSYHIIKKNVKVHNFYAISDNKLIAERGSGVLLFSISVTLNWLK
tara:strand:+ start:586 stop:951 length:366 start_codon:yes stop_codon:yes gene_type:complete